MKYNFDVETLQKIFANPWLTPRQRLVLELMYKHDWSIASISTVLHQNKRYDPRTAEDAYEVDVGESGRGVARSTVDRVLRKAREKSIKMI